MYIAMKSPVPVIYAGRRAMASLHSYFTDIKKAGTTGFFEVTSTILIQIIHRHFIIGIESAVTAVRTRQHK